MFTSAVCRRQSVCLSSVCNDWNFRHCLCVIWHIGHPLTSR